MPNGDYAPHEVPYTPPTGEQKVYKVPPAKYPWERRAGGTYTWTPGGEFVPYTGQTYPSPQQPSYAPQELPPQYAPQQYGGEVFTPEEYLSWLASLLDKWLAQGQITMEQYTTLRDNALTALNEGQWGPSLPYWSDFYKQFTAVTPEPQMKLSEETWGGQLFLVPRDAQGNIATGYSGYFRNLGPTKAGELTAQQRLEATQWEKQFEWQQQQARMELQWQQQQAGWEQQYRQQQLALQQRAYEATTAAMPPSGWIEQWLRTQSRVGYRPEPKHKRMTEQQYATRFRETIPKARQAIEGWERGQRLPSISEMPLRGNWIYIDETTPTRGLITHTITEPGIRPEYVAPATGLPSIATGMWTTPSGVVAPKEEFSRLSEIGYQMVAPPPKPPTAKKKKAVVRRPTTPPAPPGLSQFVPSQVTGQPITRAPITTPSGQQWAQTPWSQQEMLRGYGAWTGEPLEDVMQRMWAMQPQTPLGAGRQRWAAAKQWA